MTIYLEAILYAQVVMIRRKTTVKKVKISQSLENKLVSRTVINISSFV